LLGIILAYALVAQSLLITVGGFAALAQADTGATAFVLCAHNSDGAPVQPADAPAFPGCNHCIFCFAGSNQALTGSPPVLFQRVDVAVAEIARVADTHALPQPPAYSIPSPRGPPLRA
jgi:hypothetical protein